MLAALVLLILTACGGGSNSTKSEVKSQKVTFKSGYSNDSAKYEKIVLAQDIIDEATQVCMTVLNENYYPVVYECNSIKFSEKSNKKTFDDFGKTFTQSGDYQAIYIAKDSQGNEVGRTNWNPFTVSLFDAIFEEEVSISMGYISFYDYTYIDLFKIFDSSEEKIFTSGEVSFFEGNDLWSEEEYFADKSGLIEVFLYVRVGLDIDKICLSENDKKTCYILPSDFNILSKEVDLANLEKEVLKSIDLIDEEKVCDIRFDSFMPNRNMSSDFKPSLYNFEIFGCKEDVEIYIEAENFLDELEYELENSGASGYAYINSSDIAYEEVFIGVDQGVSGKVWYDIHYNPVNVELGKEYRPKFEITLRNISGDIIQQETHFMTMTTYGQKCEKKGGCEEILIPIEEEELPKKYIKVESEKVLNKKSGGVNQIKTFFKSVLMHTFFVVKKLCMVGKKYLICLFFLNIKNPGK
ncbi:MAG: hypothetical protein Q9M94_00875 [Candidatus Gracilibacteria bacterium]|nr:hypothetical protein [Candidatus Gracilibacteria bacterium]